MERQARVQTRGERGAATRGVGVGADKLWARPAHMLDSHGEHYAGELPRKFRLYLRLHNDDVHTFEEVIKALHAKSAEPIAVPVGGEGSVGGSAAAGSGART